MVCLVLASAAFAAGADATRPVDLSLWATQATQEQRPEKYFDAGLEPIRTAVNDLPFDTYKKVKVSRQAAPCGEESRLAIDERYTLFVKPVSREADGRIRLEIRIEMAPKEPGGKPVKALDTRMMLAPGEKVKFGGLKLAQGELVVVVSAT
jgi:hypothetical protein